MYSCSIKNYGTTIITKSELDLLKDDAFLQMYQRRIDEDALYNVLSSGKLSAVALDVFSQEPYSGKLCDIENVVLTPHIGSYAKEEKLKMEIDAVHNLNALNNGS